MNKTILSLAAISALAVSSFAASDLAGAFKEGKASGQIRAMYISDAFSGTTADQSTGAIGGKLKFETGSLYGISAGVSFFTTQDLTRYTTGVANMTDGTGNGYSILGEAYLAGTYGKTTVKVGRQQIDSPLAGSDDIRMIPNLFDAALVINTDLPNTTVIGGYVARMGGIDSTVTPYSKFKSMSDSAGVGTIAGPEGVYVLAAINNSVKDLTAQAWYYGAQDVLNAYYVQADYKLGNLALAAQYYNIDDTGAVKKAGADANYDVYGVKASYAIESIGLTPYVAYNATSKNAGTFVQGAWGGYPEFTGMEEWTTNSLALSTQKTGSKSMSEAKVYKVGADYSLEKLGLGNRTLTAAYGNYDYNKNVAADTKVYDVSLACENNLVKNLATKIAYEKVDSKDNSLDQTFFKVIMNYNF